MKGDIDMKGIINILIGALFGFVLAGGFILALGVGWFWLKAAVVACIVIIAILIHKYDEDGRDINILRLIFDSDYYMD